MKAMWAEIIEDVEIIDSVIGFIGVLFILSGALFVQFFYHETPCALCLLQRAAFVGLGLSLLMNVRYGNKVTHWAMGILFSITGLSVSIRQILLHITSDKGFGSAILGLHMYTWCFIGFFTAIVGCAVMLLLYPERR